MTHWRFGTIKACNMTLEADCQNEACRRFYVFDLDKLIAVMGPDYRVTEMPDLTCEACGGSIEIKLALLPPEEIEEA